MRLSQPRATWRSTHRALKPTAATCAVDTTPCCLPASAKSNRCASSGCITSISPRVRGTSSTKPTQEVQNVDL
jgi:hypothetical protein